MKKNIKNYITYSLFLYAFVSTISITLAEIFFIAGLLLWLVDAIINKKDIKKDFPAFISLPILFFVLMHFTAALTGLDPLNSMKDFRKVYIFFILFLAGSYLKSEKDINKALDFFIAGAAVVGIYAVITTLKFRYIGHNPDFRASSFSGNHMHAGGMLMMGLIVNAALLSGVLKGKVKNLKKGALYAAAFALIAAGLAFTFTRGSWFAAFAGILIITFLTDKRVFAGIIVITLIALILMKDTSFERRIKDTFRVYHGTSAIERVYMWKSGLQIIKDYPLHGVGTSNLGKVYPKYKNKDAFEANEGHLHNNLIQIAVIDGIPGLGIFLWLFTALWVFVARLIRKTAKNSLRYPTFAVFAISMVFFINGFFEYNFFSSQVAMIFWFISGTGLAINNLFASGWKEETEQQGKILLVKELKIEIDNLKRALIIRPRAIGDILLTTPFIRALKKRVPGIKIDYLCEPMGLPVLENNPYLSDIIVYEKNKLKKMAPSVRMMETAGFYAGLRAKKYDIVFDLFGNLRTALMSFLTGARYRVGFTFRGRKIFYNIKVKPDLVPKYNIYYHMDLLRAINVKDDGEKLDFYFGDEEKTYIDSFFMSKRISDKDLIVGLNPAGSWPTKRWPEQKFSGLADRLIEDLKGIKIIVLWGPNEVSMAERMVAGIKNDKSDVFIAPETSIKQLGALIKRIKVLVTNDGAPKHIADALDTPTVAIFGPTNYRSWNPANSEIHIAVTGREACAPCDKTECNNIRCMESVTPEEVFGHVKLMLNY